MTYMIASMAVPVAFLGALIMRSCWHVKLYTCEAVRKLKYL
jgi:hypothetical protein